MAKTSSRRPCATNGNQAGFILPLTLWVIAAIGVAVVAVNEWVGQAVSNAQVMRQRADTLIAVSDIQNELLFALATRPMSYRGLETGRLTEKVDRNNPAMLMAADFQTDRYVRLDGHAYRVESQPGYVVRLYDGRGMLNLNSLAGPYMRRLLGLFNIPEASRNALIDSLEDYTDRDDLTRISGAEERDYTRVGRREPANASLMTPLEAQYVMGWDRLEDLWKRDLQSPLLTTCAANGFNPNTASREALLSNFPGLTEQDMTELLERRELRPFRNIREFAATANTLVRDEPFFYTFAPAYCTIVEITHAPTGERVRFSLTVDALSAKTRPWRIDYAFPITSAATKTTDREPLPEAVFPTPDALDADQRADAEDSAAGAQSPVDRQQSNDPPSDF